MCLWRRRPARTLPLLFTRGTNLWPSHPESERPFASSIVHLALGELRTMEQVKQQSLLWAKQPTWVVGAFAAVAMLLAALGLFGVLTHTVTQQRRELALRVSLGACPADIVTRTLRSAFSMLLGGLTLGLAGAFARSAA